MKTVHGILFMLKSPMRRATWARVPRSQERGTQRLSPNQCEGGPIPGSYFPDFSDRIEEPRISPGWGLGQNLRPLQGVSTQRSVRAGLVPSTPLRVWFHPED